MSRAKAGRTPTRSTSSRSGNPAKRAAAKKKEGVERSARSLKLSPEVAWYLESRGIPVPDCPPLIKTPEPRQVAGAEFDPDAVDRVLAAFKALRHTSGKWSGQPLRPDPWQVAYIIAPVFGWVRFDAEAGRRVRIIRDLFVDVPRKNGKSTLSAGLAIYLACADGEQGAQVVTAATTEKQAGFVFNPIKTLAEKAPALRKNVQAFAKKVVHPRSGSYIEVVSSAADAQHGANIHGGIIDELHVHRTPDLVETIETGRGSRDQPLVVIITTADAGEQGTIYARKRDYVERLAKRVITDRGTYGVVWGATDRDDPHKLETWRKANPGFGISPTRAYLEAESRKAKNSPADLASFLRLHLGIRTKQSAKYISMPTWDANGGLIQWDQLAGRRAFGGLDLGSTSDLTALCWLMPRPDEHGAYDAVWRFWTPEDNLPELDRRTAGEATVWHRNGWLETTPGNVTDYAAVRAAINRDREHLNVASIAFDRWNATQLSIDLQEDGAEMIRLGQGFASLSAPLKEIQRLLLQGQRAKDPQINHGGNPVMRWMVDNLAVGTDPAGNVKPDKAKSHEKIDGVSALVNAMAEAMRAPVEKTTAYAGRGVRVV